MHPSWASIILTISQAVLIAALPKPRANELTTYIQVVADCDTQPVETRTIITRGVNDLDEAVVTTVVQVEPALSIATITLSALPSEQTPIATTDIEFRPDTTGSIGVTLETDGRPSSIPFPTSIPSITVSTLEPLDTAAPFQNATISTDVNTNTLTLPVATLETVIPTSTVVDVPVLVTATFTNGVGFNTTAISNGTAIVSPTGLSTVIATSLSQSSIVASNTLTLTDSVTLTVTGSVTGIPTASPTCIFSMGCSGQDVFQAVAYTAPPSNIQARSGHPVPRLGIREMTGPIETNKFYANFFLGSQGAPAFVLPYSMSWARGAGNAQSWGMAISHIEEDQKYFGPVNNRIPGSPNSFYLNPTGIQSLVMSAAEFGPSVVMTSDNLEAFSASIHLQPNAGSSSSITFPVVQGMAFVTAQYSNLQPAIQSGVFFRRLTEVEGPSNKPNMFKYRVELYDDRVWLIYANPSVAGLTPNFRLETNTLILGIAGWTGTIQVAKLPVGASEGSFDAAAGAYPTRGQVSGFTSGNTAEYGLSWTKSGQYANSSTLLMYALPHHVQSFGSETQGKVTNLHLETPTKGNSTAVLADYWTLVEDQLPTTMGFAPWRPGMQGMTTLSAAAKDAIQRVSPIEASQDVDAQSNLDSMYFSGKALSKFASIVYVMNDLSDQKGLAAAALAKLKNAFARFAENRQQYPLVYDSDWKGIVSSATYVTGDNGVDFGNSLYNDHHFHYGYFIHAAAIIGYLDPSWLNANKDYVNALVRDVSNPSSLDQYFPVFRSFDWYNGHSWAKGLYESGDGKDEESSSEDTLFAYALKMWGKTVGDASMEARGNLMLSVLARSLQNYFLLDSDNDVQPAQFIGNKVTGILFENKVDHTTYFGANFEYIQGIHMLPLMPFSTLSRTQKFVTEEWNTYFADGAAAPASSVQGGWRGILYANLAIINPVASYNFFTQQNFDAAWLDGGASRTWYIAFAAGLGGSP